MKTKKQRNIHLDKNDSIRAVEQDLIQTWRDGRLEVPASPLDAASLLAMQSLRFMRMSPAIPPKGEFTARLHYIAKSYNFSSAFPYTHEELIIDIERKTHEIQRRLDES